MRRKALSLLLAAAMVFSLNAVTYAAETTEAVDVETVYDDWKDVPNGSQSTNSENAKVVSANLTVKAELEKQGIVVDGITSEVTATGKKIKNDAIVGSKKLGYYFEVSANGYRTSVKKVKFTSKGKKAGETVTYKISALNGAQYVEKWDANTKSFRSLAGKDAKDGFKAIKSSLSTIKGATFTAIVRPQYVNGAVSNNLVKSLPKTVSGGDWAKVAGKVSVTKKNGNIKKVQVVTGQVVKSSDVNLGSGKYGSYHKIKLVTLKKGKDYSISGNTIVLDLSTKYYTVKANLKNFDTTNFE